NQPSGRSHPRTGVRRALGQDSKEFVSFSGQPRDSPDSVVKTLLIRLDFQMMFPRPPVPAHGDAGMVKTGRDIFMEVIGERLHGSDVGSVLPCLVPTLSRSGDPGVAARVSD